MNALDFSLSFVAQRPDPGRFARIEFAPGQVVRGTVLKVYPDNMALIDIGGTRVLARLETSLEVGQKAWLMVEPLTHPITLRVLTLDRAEGREAVWEQLLRALNVSGKEARAVVEALVKHGLPLDRQAVSAALAITAKHGTDAKLIEAFVLAAKRNLPLTEEVVLPLRAFFNQAPLSRVIRSFLAQADAFLAAEGGGHAALPSAPDPALRQAVAQLREIVGRIPLLPGREPHATATADPFAPLSPEGSSAPRLDGWKGTGTTARFASEASAPPPVAGHAVLDADRSVFRQPVAGAAPGPAPQRQAEAADSLMTRASEAATPQQVSHPTAAAKAHVPLADAAKLAQTEADTASVRGGSAGMDNRMVRAAGLASQQASAPAKSAENGDVAGRAEGLTGGEQTRGADAANPLREWLNRLGITHERRLAGQLLAGAEWAPASDNAKALLLQLVQSPSAALPAGLREAAEALLQHITGQQLMLTPPAGHPFAQLVIQIPLFTERGEDTAFVQIEAQKRNGRRLDPANCRLFFCLMMERMGPTTVDVNIINRIVNVTIHSGSSWVEPLIASLREEFADRLRSVGYHLSGLRFERAESIRPAAREAKAQVMSEYRGVDVRI